MQPGLHTEGVQILELNQSICNNKLTPSDPVATVQRLRTSCCVSCKVAGVQMQLSTAAGHQRICIVTSPSGCATGEGLNLFADGTILLPRQELAQMR